MYNNEVMVNIALDRDTENEVRDQILALSEAWSEAIVANDPESIGRYMTDDWIIVSEHGVLKKEDFMSLVRSGQLAHSAMEMAEFGNFKLYGETAVLASRVTSVARFGGQEFPANEWTSDVFIKTDGGWKCAITHVTTVKEI